MSTLVPAFLVASRRPVGIAGPAAIDACVSGSENDSRHIPRRYVRSRPPNRFIRRRVGLGRSASDPSAASDERTETGAGLSAISQRGDRGGAETALPELPDAAMADGTRTTGGNGTTSRSHRLCRSGTSPRPTRRSRLRWWLPALPGRRPPSQLPATVDGSFRFPIPDTLPATSLATGDQAGIIPAGRF